MNIFYHREETPDAVTIRYKPWYPVLALALVAIMVLSSLAGGEAQAGNALASTIFWLLIVLIFWRVLAMRGIRKEIFEAMRSGSVELSGSRFNPKNPLTVTIKKPPAEPEPAEPEA